MQVTAARPYVWPYDGAIDPAHTALLVFTGDTTDVTPAEPLQRLQSLAKQAKASGMKLVLLPRSGPLQQAPPFVPDYMVARPSIGAFWGSDVDLVLRNAGLTHLLIAGFPFELGADCTMREANDLGYECLLVEDCCSGLAEDTFSGAVSSVTMSGGIFGAVATSEAVLAALTS